MKEADTKIHFLSFHLNEISRIDESIEKVAEWLSGAGEGVTT